MIRDGQVAVFYLFDVAESIDLQQLSTLLRAAAAPAPFASKPAVPSYVGYQTPPVQIDGASLGFPVAEGFQIRIKVFDYGIVSLAMTRRFTGEWAEFVALASRLANDSGRERQAEQWCRRVVQNIVPALQRPRAAFLSEDYFVFSITSFDQQMPANHVLAEYGEPIAQLLRAETQPLATEERDEVLRHHLSYLADDLVVPTWSSALVYDTESGVQATLELLEFANSQLLQFRYYDELLDARLADICKEIETRSAYTSWWPRRYTKAARRVHALFIDVNDLTDRTENSLKLVGDVYAARLLALVHARLGVTTWRESVREKLNTLDEIYRFAVDQTAMERGEILELAIVAILVFELILFFMGIMK